MKTCSFPPAIRKSLLNSWTEQQVRKIEIEWTTAVENRFEDYPESLRGQGCNLALVRTGLKLHTQHGLGRDARIDGEIVNAVLTAVLDWLNVLAVSHIPDHFEEAQKTAFQEARSLLGVILEPEVAPPALALAMFDLGSLLQELEEPVFLSMKQSRRGSGSRTLWHDEVRAIVSRLGGSRAFEEVLSAIEERTKSSDTCFISVSHDMEVIRLLTRSGSETDIDFSTLKQFLQRKTNFL